MIMVEVVMYLPSANEIISTNQQQTKVIQEVVSTAVSKLMYCTRKRDQMLFSPGKKLDRKTKQIHHNPCQPIILVDGLCYIMR